MKIPNDDTRTKPEKYKIPDAIYFLMMQTEAPDMTVSA